MKCSRFNQFALSSLISISALSFGQSAAQAIVINRNAGEDTALLLGAPFTAVTQITSFFGETTPGSGENISGSCTGSLISPTLVLTAQHCFVLDSDGIARPFLGSNVLFRDSNQEILDVIPVNALLQIDALDIEDAQLVGLDGTDIAILQLVEPAPESITPLRLIDDAEDLIGSTFTMVGFGLQGVDIQEQAVVPPDNLRWAAENTIDFFGDTPLPFGETIVSASNIFLADFDDGTLNSNTTLTGFGISSSQIPLANEGMIGGGDSGGPLLVNRDGEFLIAGVTSAGTAPVSSGAIGIWTATAPQRSFFEAAVPFVSTPEHSSTFTMITLGAIGAGGLIRVRKRVQ